jgi:hypothetical protein
LGCPIPDAAGDRDQDYSPYDENEFSLHDAHDDHERTESYDAELDGKHAALLLRVVLRSECAPRDGRVASKSEAAILI